MENLWEQSITFIAQKCPKIHNELASPGNSSLLFWTTYLANQKPFIPMIENFPN